MKQRLLSLLLALALLLALLPGLAAPVRAGDEYAGSCGDDLTWRFDPDTGLLSIEGEGDMYDFTSFSSGYGEERYAPWSSFRDHIREISLPEGLTHIGDFAFSECRALKELVLPARLQTIGVCAFFSCNGLTSVRLPEGLTEIRSSAFAYSGLTALRLPESLRKIEGDAFFCCYKLQELTLGGELSELGSWIFAGCDKLETVAISAGFSVDLERNVFMNAFAGLPSFSEEPGLVLDLHDCPMLTAFAADAKNPNFSTDEAGLLYNKDKTVLIACPMGKSGTVTVPEGVTGIERNAFEFCRKLEQLRFPETLTKIGESAFTNCTGLTSLRFPASLGSIADNAFLACTGLRSVRLPGPCEIGTNAFQTCLSLAEFVCRDPSCLAESYNAYIYMFGGDDTEEDLSEPDVYEYEFASNLGIPEKTIIFGVHDDEKENAEMVIRTESTGTGTGYREECAWGFRWVENYAKTYDYRFCETGRFTDVKEDSYYELPVAWAVTMGITSGTGEGQFSPKQTCTREQIVTFLWKALGAPDPEASESPFSDVKPGKYYFKPVLWAVENGVTGGMGDGKFGVGRPCTREQAVSFLWKALGAPEPEGTESTFTDVKPGKYYYKPVLWAAENGVTGGVGDGKFGVGSTCTRAQIVTFLYKAFQN